MYILTLFGILLQFQVGYRHIDTAQVYGNEADVGLACKQSGIPRSQIYVTTKLWSSQWGYDRATAAIKSSLTRLGLDYVDLMLLHHPADPNLRAETWRALEDSKDQIWRALEDAKDQGLLKSIGVSNFSEAHIEKLLLTAKHKPVVNQIEIHPFLQRRALVKYCQKQGISLQAYSPLTRGIRLNDASLKFLADKKGITTAQLLIRWTIQKGYITLPKSVNAERQFQNFNVTSFELSSEEMDSLDDLEEGWVSGWDPVANDPV
ncbi:hypothetical protein CEUSTIGMA_g8117.t1 [Chlamydomonas eustigma]|uniref:NADP-dependent oxidoreductase domain-containing protein n=1 Tax=Chlamydomonas eustigma TaxID=1157962 RepID=A0A250XCR5_9CHLO|nr:hypothetical protein CEUSTIGMA_g8117.t1 [Chlamydomonas eustigma]|eukprot:GAX80682.1 hypothetical protein CEUSTIGMA_g8117.t1 [Chlamydomonas eustigma]